MSLVGSTVSNLSVIEQSSVFAAAFRLPVAHPYHPIRRRCVLVLCRCLRKKGSASFAFFHSVRSSRAVRSVSLVYLFKRACLAFYIVTGVHCREKLGSIRSHYCGADSIQ